MFLFVFTFCLGVKPTAISNNNSLKISIFICPEVRIIEQIKLLTLPNYRSRHLANSSTIARRSKLEV